MLLKTVFREIRRSLGRYLAIFAIVALGVGFLNGLRVTKAAMLKTLNEYAARSNLFDYEMISTLGFTQSDVDAFAALSGVRDAVGSYSADMITVNKDGGDSVLKAFSLTDGVNMPELIAGRMPQSAGECVADANRFSESDIGGTIVLSDSNSSDTMEQFAFRQYRIVGIVKSVTYINFERGSTSLANGVVSGFVYLLPSGFQMSAYTEIYVTLENGGYVYSQEYDDNSAAMETPLKDLVTERAEERYEQLKTDGQSQIDKAKEKLADGQKEYDAQKADGEETGRSRLVSAGKETVISLTPEKKVLYANGQDLCFLNIGITDRNGIVKSSQDRKLSVTVTGGGTLQAFGSARPTMAENFTGTEHTAYYGRALAVIRAGYRPGIIRVEVTGPDLEKQTVVIETISDQREAAE